MITVRRLDGKEYTLNSDIIESIEATPDTIITLITGKKLVVAESVDDIVVKIIQYKKKIYSQYNQEVKHKGNGV